MNIRRITLALLLAATSLLLVAPVAFAEGGAYTVAAGDTLFEIAAKLLGDGNRYLEIVQLTNEQHAEDSGYAFIENPNLIEIGWKLAVPGAAFTPGRVAGGPVWVKASGSSADVRWILPGLRNLDPKIFGTPDMPLGFEEDVGLPLEARMTNEEGTEYTTTAAPGPFSDNFKMIEGTFNLEAVDATLIDGMSTEDKVDFTASFTGPDGKQYSLKILMVIPMGPDHPFLGGVATNFMQHGMTGIGTKLMPTMYVYVAFWGVGELSIDGEVVASNRIVHGMISSNVRDEEYKLVFDDGVDNSKIHFHLILPNIEVTPDGPQTSPVPTGFEMPNGMEQPFLHIMYEDVTLN